MFALMTKQFFPIAYWAAQCYCFYKFPFYEFSPQFGLENVILGSSKGSNNQSP